MTEANQGRRDVPEGTLLWQPPPERQAQRNLRRYMRWLAAERGRRFGTYDELWQWSVTDLEGFWASIWDFFQIGGRPSPAPVLARRQMPGTVWYPNASLNYAEHALRRRDDHIALIFQSERHPLTRLTYAELYSQVASVAAALRGMGVQKGDRVVAYLPNIPQALVAFLAAASLGATWSSCSPDFGTRSVVDRFQQIEPKVLFAVDGYSYGGKTHDRLAVAAEIRSQLPTLQATVLVPYLQADPPAATLPGAVRWESLLAPAGEMQFTPVPFDHPLWVLYSSGTTGLPKAIVQGHGGILLEHYKQLSLQLDLKPEDRFFWFTTTGWMMWNLLISGLLLGTTVVLYDGSPGHPDMDVLWRLAQDAGVTYFGTSAPYLIACAKAGIHPGRDHDLSRIHSLGSTGAPLPPGGFQWVYDEVKADLLLGSVSGGTDVCTAFVGSSPLLPVYAGEIQCRSLGAKVEAFDDMGQPLSGDLGELVITEPLPSMPLFFWNDPDGVRYQDSYFAMYSGIWRHSDWIKITERGTCVVTGRSDSTLNRGGVRMGSSEFYRVVEGLPEVLDSLVADTSSLDTEGQLLLFVVLRPGAALDEALIGRINRTLRQELSPRHVPDAIYAVPEVPRTLNGKKMEVPIKRLLMGTPAERVANPGTMGNPQSLTFFLELAKSRQ